MANGNGNGHVTVKLREKAEKILLSKYDRKLRKVEQKHDALQEKTKKQVTADLGLDKLLQKLKKEKEKCEDLEQEIIIIAGASYVSKSAIESGEVSGRKIDKEVRKRTKSKLDFSKEKERLENLKDKLLEELWLAGQSDEVKQILSRMD